MSWVSLNDDIIPGLPNDLALRCLAKLSHGYHGVLECVCKRWRVVVKSLDFIHLKAREGWCGNWLFVLSENQTNVQWNAYDPQADRWHSLPRIPATPDGFKHLGFSCVTVHNKFLVIGGHFCQINSFIPQKNFSPTNRVVQFDPFTKQWSNLASMQMERSDFACAVVCGKVYVAGGWNPSSEQLHAAEVYDPLRDRWDHLPPLLFSQASCHGASYDGGFLVFKRKSELSSEDVCQVFDPFDNKWCPLKDMCPSVEVMSFTSTDTGDHLYTVIESDKSIIYSKHKDQPDWHPIGKIPPVLLPNHSRQLESFSFRYTLLGSDFYVVGGKVIKWIEFFNTFDIVQLDLVRACDLSVSPLKWRLARSMRETCGDVVACASLKE